MRIILRDGRAAELRTPVASDRNMLRALFQRASRDSLYFRFFHVVAEVQEVELDRMMRVQAGEAYALVCDAGDAILGIGNYARTGPDSAEVAFFVDDRLQGRGLGTLLLEHLAEQGWREGFKTFLAYVLSENHQMQGVFRSSGFAVTQRWSDGAYELALPLGQTERQKSLAALREKLAAAASLQPFFHPRTVAVVGASRDVERLGHQMLKHLLDGGFQGTVYPVNREAQSVLAIRAYARLADVPEPVDLALLVVPPKELLSVVNDAIYAGVRGVTITTSGLDPSLQETIVTKLRRAGIRLVGPSSMGLVNTHPALSLNASLADVMPHRGRLAVASHSGALGVALMRHADDLNLGISSFVSLGDKPDVSVNDLLQFWEDDPDSDAIMLYMESFGNPRKFSRIARRLTRQKPILAVKSARTRRAGTDVAFKQVAWDGADAPVEALFQQSGIIRADTLEELFDVAAIVTTQPVVRGSRIGLVTNSAAGTLIAEDAVYRLGLELAYSIDVGYENLVSGYRTALKTILSQDIDALVILYVPVSQRETDQVVAAIEDTLRDYLPTRAEPLPVTANIMLQEPAAHRFLRAGERRVPVFAFPETALRALARVRDYGQYLAQPLGREVDLPRSDAGAARQVLRQLLAERGPGMISDQDLVPVWDHMGIPLDIGAGGLLSVAMMWDPLFGPILGVRSTDGESRIRLVPLTDQDARRLVPSSIRTAQAAELWCDVLLRWSRLIDECPELRRLEVNGVDVRDGRLLVEECSVTLGT